ncbi:YcjF family protein [Oricola thermophila]|uniref:TIGR01620 family protein n=1 Tax=Oricola thermophila TaxID=2742145 RepID=A0A6N1V9J7_9HYPH|nr:TIGR01620 family protein [Oricola thermophila]QKV17681.1 TIGR01620 family protein [Oricola thermophila]
MNEKPKRRKPRAYTPEAAPADSAAPQAPTPTPRKPRAFAPGPALEMEPEDFFEREETTTDMAVIEEVDRQHRGLSFASLGLAATGLLAGLAVSLWIDGVVRALFARNEWLGWLSLGLAGIIALTVAIVVIREIAAIWRLRSVDRLRGELETALAAPDDKALSRATHNLLRHMASNPRSAAGRAVLARQDGEIIDAADFYALAERELFRSLDRDAFLLVTGAAKRVSVVTAVSPRAFLDMAYVIYENFRLVRRLAELYGGRSGTFGNLRLFRKVLGHLAITGAASIGDGLVQQVIGHGVASRLSARLGEGVLNGVMTARVGISAMEVCRPAPFHAVKRPKLSSVLSVLTAGNDDADSD